MKTLPVKTLGVLTLLLVLPALAACAHRADLGDTLQLWQMGEEAAVIRSCEEELARWKAADAAVAAQLPAARETVRAMLADDALLIAPDETPSPTPPPALRGRAPSPLAAELRDRGLDLGGRGDALRELAADLLSDAPLKIIRAASQARELRSRALVPHLIADIFSPRPLRGPADALEAHEHPARMLVVKAYALETLREILL